MKYYESEMPAPDFTECFSRPADGRELLADIFVPGKSGGNGAAVVFIHGGGWCAGERRSFLWHAHRLSLRGYVACTIDYRLTPTAPFPAALLDCQAAVKWLRHQAARFGIRGDRIGAMGSSAGGHLAACLGVLDDAGEPGSARVNCVVDVHGVHDFVAHQAGGGKIAEYMEAFIGGPVSEKRALWIEASPALHVDQNSAPMLLMHDPHDDTVPYEQSLLLAKALMEAGRPMQFLPTPGSGHGFVYNPQKTWTQKVWPNAMAWFDRHLLDSEGDEAIGGV